MPNFLRLHAQLARPLLHSPPCMLHLLRYAAFPEVVDDPREWRQCGDSEGAGGEESGDSQCENQSCGDQDWAEDHEKWGGDGEADEGSGESEAGEDQEDATDGEEGDHSQNLWSWRPLFRHEAWALLVLGHGGWVWLLQRLIRPQCCERERERVWVMKRWWRRWGFKGKEEGTCGIERHLFDRWGIEGCMRNKSFWFWMPWTLLACGRCGGDC